MLNMTNKKTIGIVVLLIVAVIAAVFIYRDMRGDVNGGASTASDEKDTLKNMGIEPTGDGKVEIVTIPEVKLPEAPALVRSTDFKNTLTPEIKMIVLARLDANIEALKKNPKDVQSWIMLGVNRKTLGDYEGARDAWGYAKALEPNNIVPWNNLGDLYHFYLKDYKKSEENWKRTIALKSDYIQGYSGLVDLYKYSMKENLEETPALLKDGISKNPDSIDLVVMLARYYQDVGNITLAKEAYGQAIAIAERLNNTSLAITLKAELAGVK